MVDIVKGGGRAHSNPTLQPGLTLHHDGMYAKKWPLPLCVLCGTVGITHFFYCRCPALYLQQCTVFSLVIVPTILSCLKALLFLAVTYITLL